MEKETPHISVFDAYTNMINMAITIEIEISFQKSNSGPVFAVYCALSQTLPRSTSK